MPVKRTRTGSSSAQRSQRTRAVVERTVFEIEAGAKMRARVDTGEMRAGLQGEMTGDFEGRVRGLAAHTVFNELGTVHMAAQPMLVPAAEEAREPYRRSLAEAWA
jgi:hypothetical protein